MDYLYLTYCEVLVCLKLQCYADLPDGKPIEPSGAYRHAKDCGANDAIADLPSK